MNLIILEENDRIEKDTFKLSGQRAEHIRKVLKLELNDCFEVGQVNGNQGTATIIEDNSKKIVIKCSWFTKKLNIKPEIDLICALPRPQTLKDLLQTAATMQIRRVHLINANRVEVCYFSASVMQEEIIKKNLLKGLSQGKATRLPEICIHKRFKVFFSQTLPKILEKEDGKFNKIILTPETDESLSIESVENNTNSIVAIGPEGGWVPFEIEFMRKFGFSPYSLGPWPLRVENAAVAAVSQIELIQNLRSKHFK